MSAQVQAVRFRALGTTAEVITDPTDALADAERILAQTIALLDEAASRFRPDAEIALLATQPGRPIRVSLVLGEVIGVALRAAKQTGGLVDPTVGSSLVALGYDRDFDSVAPDGDAVSATPAPGWQSVGWNALRREVTLPAGVVLDVGATAKAWAADTAAAQIHDETGAAALVNLGGDIAVAGPSPAGGWPVHIGDDHRERPDTPGDAIALTSGGLATSSSSVRQWRRGGRGVHHIVDPATGEPAAPVWRTVSVVAASAVDANTASTASMVMGEPAPAWLERLGLAARLVSVAGDVVRVGTWP
ncbi:MAG: FAD:protein transferase [Thermoleophilaceae bacterium]|nr:FAD:protein transferase [Thermoleophilaceae bacterium]